MGDRFLVHTEVHGAIADAAELLETVPRDGATERSEQEVSKKVSKKVSVSYGVKVLGHS